MRKWILSIIGFCALLTGYSQTPLAPPLPAGSTYYKGKIVSQQGVGVIGCTNLQLILGDGSGCVTIPNGINLPPNTPAVATDNTGIPVAQTGAQAAAQIAGQALAPSSVAAGTVVTALNPVNVASPIYGMSPLASASANTTAFNAAVTAASTTAPGAVYIPSGNYSVTCPLTVTVGSIRVYGDGSGSILSCANSSSADSVLYFNGGSGMYGDSADHLTLNGNSHVSYGLHSLYAHDSTFSNMLVRNVTNCGFEYDHTVVSELYSPRMNANNGFPALTQSPDEGICVNNSTQVSVYSPDISGATITGVMILGSSGTQINSGTIEAIGASPGFSNGTCISLGSNSNNNMVNGTDLEQCSTASVVQGAGTTNLFLNLFTPADFVHVATSASNTSIIGGRLGALTIDVGATDTTIDGSPVISGAYTNNSATTTVTAPMSVGSGDGTSSYAQINGANTFTKSQVIADAGTHNSYAQVTEASGSYYAGYGLLDNGFSWWMSLGGGSSLGFTYGAITDPDVFFLTSAGVPNVPGWAGGGKLPLCVDNSGTFYMGTNTAGVLACP